MARKQAPIWQFFNKSESEASAICKRCSQIIKTTGGSTTGLHTHMRSIHNINLDFWINLDL